MFRIRITSFYCLRIRNECSCNSSGKELDPTEISGDLTKLSMAHI